MPNAPRPPRARHRARWIWTATLVLGAGLARPAPGQFTEPVLLGLSAAGGQAGRAVELTVTGTAIETADSLWFSHPGLRAAQVKGPTFKVEIGPDVPPGYYDVRSVGKNGLSNPRTFVVGSLPESTEVEPNQAPAQASPIAINSTANGQIATPADVDYFAFEGTAGRRILIDLASERLDGRLDATMHLIGPDGRTLAEDRDSRGADPFLDATLPADGRYLIRVADVIFGGSPQHVYRLTLHDGPSVDSASPRVLKPGEAAGVTLLGRNLGGDPAGLDGADGRPLERREVTVELTPDASRTTAANVYGVAALACGMDYAFERDGQRAAPIFLAAADGEVTPEAEPNDDHPRAQDVTLPAEIDGTFGAVSDLDLYRFKAKKGEVLWVEATAARLGSPADPAFVIQKVDDKGAAADLAVGDDQPDAGTAPRMNLGSVDASVRWEVPDDGTYQVAVSDLFASQRGDARLAYRLTIRPARPDFRVFVVPEATAAPGTLNVRAGGKANARVLAWRDQGFDRPIRIEPIDLPEGLKCDPVVIAAGQVVAPVVVEAAQSCKPGPVSLRFIGRSLQPDGKPDPMAVEHPALPASLVAAEVPGRARLTRGLPLMVLGEAPLEVSWSVDRTTVTPGRRLDFAATVARRAGFSGPVAIASTDLPPGATAVALTVEPDRAEGKASVVLPKAVAPGIYTIMARGSGTYSYPKEPGSKEMLTAPLSEPTGPIVLTVRPAPATAQPQAPAGPIRQGGTLDVPVAITRVRQDAGPVRVELLADADSGLAAEPLTLPADAASGTLTIKAADSAAAGPRAVYVRVSAEVDGERLETDEPLALMVAPR